MNVNSASGDNESVSRGAASKTLAILGISITALTLASSVHDVYTEWHGDHFERVGGTIVILLAALVITTILSVVALIGGWRSHARKWGFIALASAIITPLVFVIVVFVWAA
jgi:hypothetical protein